MNSDTNSNTPIKNGPLSTVLRGLYTLEDVLLAVILTAMIVLAAYQIILRNFFDGGIVWADPLLRVMVLWLGLLGALAASRGDNQISIDLLSRFLKGRVLAASGVLTAAFTALVCAVLAYAGWLFVKDSYEFGETIIRDLPAWWFQAIVPISFALMAWRYSLLVVIRLLAFIKNEPPQNTAEQVVDGGAL